MRLCRRRWRRDRSRSRRRWRRGRSRRRWRRSRSRRRRRRGRSRRRLYRRGRNPTVLSKNILNRGRMIQSIIQSVRVVLESRPNCLRWRSPKWQMIHHVVDPLHITLRQDKDNLIRITNQHANCVNSMR
jgi:hypothetical protein